MPQSRAWAHQPSRAERWDDRSRPSDHVGAVSAGIPGLRSFVARHLAALASRHRRSWAQRSGLDRPVGRWGPKLVAITATRPGGIRQLALSAALYLCRKRAADQSGGSDRGRITAPG